MIAVKSAKTPEPSREDMENATLMYKALRAVLRPLAMHVYHLEAIGIENVPENGPVILASNHVSFMDSVWVPVSVPRPIVYLAKAEYFDSWKSGWFFRSLGMIPLDRQSRNDAESALGAAVRLLREGGVLGVYPEGTRSPDGRLYRGRTGVARLVLRSGAPVVPVGVSGSREVMPKGARLPSLSGKVIVRFGKPLVFAGHVQMQETESTLRTITDEVMFQIMALSGQEYVDRYATQKAAHIAPADLRPPSDKKLG